MEQKCSMGRHFGKDSPGNESKCGSISNCVSIPVVSEPLYSVWYGSLTSEYRPPLNHVVSYIITEVPQKTNITLQVAHN